MSDDRATATEKSESIAAETVGLFTSVRTTILLLMLLALASIVGTVIPQGDAGQLSSAASPFVARLVVILDLDDLYGSWWFLLLLMLLAINLLACLIKRIPQIFNEWSGESRKSSFKLTFVDKRPPGDLRAILTSVARPVVGGAPLETNEENTVKLTWVRHRVYLLGFPFIHMGIIVILLGGLLGVLYGFKGHIVIKEGEVGQEFVEQDSRKVRQLPFQIAVDKFTLKTYQRGSGKRPKEFRSDVRLLDSGKVAVAAPILVNHPLSFKGISLYQADYQVAGVKSVDLELVESDGKARTVTLTPREMGQLPETPYRAKLLSLDPGTTLRGAGVELQIEAEGRPPMRLGVFTRDKTPAKIDTWEIRFLGYEPLYATGLQIGHDPGTPVVWTGSILLCTGFLLTLFTNHRRLWIELTPRGDESHIQVYGRSKRLRREFRESVESAVEKGLRRTEPKSG